MKQQITVVYPTVERNKFESYCPKCGELNTCSRYHLGSNAPTTCSKCKTKLFWKGAKNFQDVISRGTNEYLRQVDKMK